MDELLIDYLLEDDFPWNNVVNAIVNEDEREADHDLIEPRNNPAYNKDYFENVVPQYTITDFKNHFRMSREVLQNLCECIAPFLHERHIYICLEKKVCFFIWTIAKQESFLAVSDRFGFNKGTGYYVFKRILRAVAELKERFIRWPPAVELNQLATRMEEKCRVPGIVGAIDGTHILIKQPVRNAIDFYNRKQQHSIILQAVCDDKKIFTDVYIGMPGRLHDARVFRNSPLYDKLVSVPPLLPPEQHILGDAAYPLMQNLLKPYRDNGHLTAQQVNFNTVISGQRSIIERAFGLLKGKWRRLKYLDMSLPHMLPEVILAACVLHNFVLTHAIVDEDMYYEENNGNENALPQQYINNDYVVHEDNDVNGILKRDHISNLLHNI